MKKYIWSVIIALTAFACADEDYQSAFREYAGINTAGLATSVAENSPGGIKIPVIYGGDASIQTPVTVTYEVTGGTNGEDFLIDGVTGNTGSVTFPAGTLKEGSTMFIVVKGKPDFDSEDDVNLVITLKSADRDVKIGFPFKTTHSVKIADDDCPFEFEGELDGEDGAPDGDDGLPADVTIVNVGDGEYTFDGVSFEMISEYWGETILASAPVTATIALGGAITIEEQFIYTTDWQGNPYDYNIVGTGQVNYCDGTISLNYDIVYADGSGSVAAGLGVEFFTATLTPVVPDED